MMRLWNWQLSQAVVKFEDFSLLAYMTLQTGKHHLLAACWLFTITTRLEQLVG